MEPPHATPPQLLEHVLEELNTHANPDNVEGMARFGISPVGTLGVGMPIVRALARDARRELRRDAVARHELAALLWDSGAHEARLMAALVDDPQLVDPTQTEAWVADVDSWDICDQLCINLLRHTKDAWLTAERWSSRGPEFTKRAGFVLAATLAVHQKSDPDERFLPALAWIARESTDERNGVKKGVNWALRQIGKRSPGLNAAAIQTAEQILAENPSSRSARWIARDALRELRSEAVAKRLAPRL